MKVKVAVNIVSPQNIWIIVKTYVNIAIESTKLSQIITHARVSTHVQLKSFLAIINSYRHNNTLYIINIKQFRSWCIIEYIIYMHNNVQLYNGL